MIKKLRNIFLILVIMAILTTGCSSATKNGSAASSASDDTAAAAVLASSGTSSILVDKEFSAKDLEVGYDDSSATKITLNKTKIEVSGTGAKATDGVLTISSKGTYVIEGTLTDGQIVIDAGDEDKVHLILNGVSVHCSDSAPIYVKNADKVFITLAENTENTLTDEANYVQTDDNTVDAVIFSTADLTLNGKGTLNITGVYKHGIVSKDDLVFTGGTYQITAAKDAINGKDCVKIQDGNFNLSATAGNAIQSKNSEDNTTGYVYITGGTITITECVEGIEGTAIIIERGNIDITSSDDGLNAASASETTTQDQSSNMPSDNEVMPDGQTSQSSITADSVSSAAVTGRDLTPSESGFQKPGGPGNRGQDNSNMAGQDGSGVAGPGKDFGGPGGGGFGNQGGGTMENDTNCYIQISGGNIKVNASGDGIDSNGSIDIPGGEIYVSGPVENNNGGLDYNGTAVITGGTVVVAGSSGMAQGFSEASSQYSLLYNLTSGEAAGTKISLTDADGNTIVSFTPDKEYQSVVISSPELKGNSTYTLTCGDQTADITLSSIVTSNGQTGGFGMRGINP